MRNSKQLIVTTALILTTTFAFAAKPETAASGLIYESLKDGTGAQPSSTDSVTVNYKGTLANGTEFDSSYKRGEPATFPLNRVIPCWTEGVAKMKEGGKARLTCPPADSVSEINA